MGADGGLDCRGRRACCCPVGGVVEVSRPRLRVETGGSKR